MWDLQLGNALFIFVMTVGTFVVFGIAVKLMFRDVPWKWIGMFISLEVGIAILNVYSTATPRITLEVELPKIPDKELKIEKGDLIPERRMKEWRESTDKFDIEQDKRVKENVGEL